MHTDDSNPNIQSLNKKSVHHETNKRFWGKIFLPTPQKTPYFEIGSSSLHFYLISSINLKLHLQPFDHPLNDKARKIYNTLASSQHYSHSELLFLTAQAAGFVSKTQYVCLFPMLKLPFLQKFLEKILKLNIKMFNQLNFKKNVSSHQTN